MQNESKLPVSRSLPGLTDSFYLSTFVLGLFFLISSNNNALMAQASSQPSISSATIPQGYIAVSLPAAGVPSSGTLFSIPIESDPVYVGNVSTCTSNSVVVSGTPWTAGSWDSTTSPPYTAEVPYYLKFLSGAESGRILQITSNTANTLTLATNDSSGATVALDTVGFSVSAGTESTLGDSFEIYPGDTLSTLFGNAAASNLLLVGAKTAAAADTVSLFDPAIEGWHSYFFSTSNGYNYWTDQFKGTNLNNLPVFPGSAVLINRSAVISANAVPLMILGRAPLVPSKIKVRGNRANLITSLSLPYSIFLKDLAAANKFQSAPNPALADNITLYDTKTAKWDITYFPYQKNGSSTVLWAVSGPDGTNLTDQSDTAIAAGTVLLITKNNQLTGSQFYIQGPNTPY